MIFILLCSVRAILDHVDPDAACPECRTRGVFVHALELKATEKLIRQRRAHSPGLRHACSRTACPASNV